MNKEITKAQLKAEERALKEMKKVFEKARVDVEHQISALSARKDLENVQSIVYQTKYQKAILEQINSVLDQLNSKQYTTLQEFMDDSYKNGYIGSMYDLKGQGIPMTVPIDPKKMSTAIVTDSKLSKEYYQNRVLPENLATLKRHIRQEITRGIAGGKTWNEMAWQVAQGMNSPFNKALSDAMRIVRTEGHRINQQGFLDAAETAVKEGAEVVKQWDATLDGDTRPAHQLADGQIKEINDYFIVGGERMKAPGIGGSAKNVCNCRCQLLQRARWALDQDELDTLKARAEYFGLDKTKDFDEFKAKYLILPKADISGIFNIKDVPEDLKTFIYNYTDGDYSKICEYSQYILNPDMRVSKFYKNDFWVKEILPEIPNDIKHNTETLVNIIKNQPVTNVPLCRIEANMIDVDVDDVLSFGIRSTSRDMEFAEKIFNGDVEGFDYDQFNGNFIEYRFKTSKNFKVDEISAYKDQLEHLICGEYRVTDVEVVENVTRGWKYEMKPIKEVFPDVEMFTSKKGKEMVKYIEDGKEKTMTYDKYINGKMEVSHYDKGSFGRKIIYLEAVE